MSHDVSFDASPRGTVAACSCGWQSRALADQTAADDRALDHLDAAHHAADTGEWP